MANIILEMRVASMPRRRMELMRKDVMDERHVLLSDCGKS